MESRSASKSSFAAGYLWTFGATALPLLSAFLISLITARWMGPRVVGLINSTMALATVLLIVGKYGVDGAASRLLSEYQVTAPWRMERLIRLSVLMRLMFTVPTGIAAVILAPWFTTFFKDPALLPLFRMSGFLILAVSLNELFDLMILGISRFRYLFFVRCSMLAGKVSLVLAAALLGMGAEGVLGGFIAGTFVPCIISVFVLFGIRGGEAPVDDAEPVWSRLFRLATPLAVSGASVTIYTLQDKLMLLYYQGAYDVGLYSMARSLTETSLFPTFALVMTLRPGLATAYAEGNVKRCADLTNRSIRGSFIYAAAVVVVFSCLARPIVVGLFKEAFAPSAALLMLFLPLIVMRCIGVVVLPGLIAANRAGVYARLTFAGAVLNFIFNMILIPRFKSQGAIVATLISYIPIEVLGLKALWGAFPRFWHRADMVAAAKTIVASGVIVLAYRAFIEPPASLFVTILHALGITVVFAAAEIALRVVTRGEIADIARSLRLRGRG
jgi:O-antigen/teichoic acid export membrane protein